MNIKRMRGRNNRPPSGGGGGGGGYRPQNNSQAPVNRNHVFDSIGPDLRVRGTAQQLFERYLQLGRDATGGGDRVMAESYFQHAEHYFRILNAMSQAQAPQQQQQHAPPHPQQRRYQNGPEPIEEFGDAGDQPEMPMMSNGQARENGHAREYGYARENAHPRDTDGDANGPMPEPREPG